MNTILIQIAIIVVTALIGGFLGAYFQYWFLIKKLSKNSSHSFLQILA